MAAIGLIAGVLILLPYFHYRVNQIKKNEPVMTADFALEELNTRPLPEETEFAAGNLLKTGTRLIYHNLPVARIYIIKKNEHYFLGVKWLKSFPPEEFSDCSFYLATTNGHVGDILTAPYPGLFTAYVLESFSPANYKLLIIRNYDKTILNETEFAIK